MPEAIHIDWADVPGYTAAIEEERALRDGAFALETESVCGILLRPLNAWHLLILEACGSPFVWRRVPDAVDVARAYWLCAPDFSPDAPRARARMLRRVGRLDFDAACEAFHQYIKDALQDSPESTGAGDAANFASWVALLIHALATAYGWQEKDILQIPLKRAWQYMRCIEKAADDTVSFINPSDRVKRLHLQQLTRNN